MSFYSVVRSLLFRFRDPEMCHNDVINLMSFVGAFTPAYWVAKRCFKPSINPDPVEAFGLKFPNRVGLAAGYDKDGLGWRGLSSLGFGHIELGTVTLKPQKGNPPPRIFRLIEDTALINRMGFPNRGAEFLLRRVQGKRPLGLVLGVNIGKNLTTPLSNAVGDYLNLYRIFAPYSDYITINVSSPNTNGLRCLQAMEPLSNLLSALRLERSIQTQHLSRRVPILVKLAPDLSYGDLDTALDVVLAFGMDGVVFANSTLSREGLRSTLKSELGGMSGLPVRYQNTELVRYVVKRTEGKLPVVASGGVMSPSDALEKLEAGATLVQIYTGLVYSGPMLVRRIVETTG